MSVMTERKPGFDARGMDKHMTDAHAHILTEKEAKERIHRHLVTMVSAGTPEEAERVKGFCGLPGAQGVLIPTFGLHPWHSDEWSVQQMRPYMEKGSVIGEIGMDGIWCEVPLARQQEVFEQQLAFAVQTKKPVVLHTKEQERKIAELICRYPNRYLVHWYSADHDLERYLDLDCFFSIGPDVIWNPSVQEVARRVRPERLLVETDGMEAVRWAFDEGRRVGAEVSGEVDPMSADESLWRTIEKTAALRGCDPHSLQLQIEKNFWNFLNKDSGD